MAPRRKAQTKRRIESYDHRDNEHLKYPPVGLVTPDTDKDAGNKACAFDPHLDPRLQRAGANEGWARLARNLKAGIDEELIEAYRGTVSLPFEPGDHRRIAVKIVDDRGIESLRILSI